MEKRRREDRSGTADYKLMSGLFFRLLPYQILLIVINAVNGIVDGLAASNFIGKDGMAAIGLYGPMNHFLYALSIMLLSGAQLLYGKYIANKPEKVQSVFSVDILLAFGTSVLTAVLLVLAAATDATSVMVAEEAQRQMFNRYVLGQAIGIPALVVGQQLFAFLSLENKTKWTMSASIACFLINAVTDVIFVKIIPLGTFGLGLSTSLSMIIFLIIQIAYYFTGNSALKITFASCSWKDAPDIIKRGYSGAISRFVEMFRCIIVNMLILKFVGSVGMSSFAASNSVMAIFWALPFGMAAVARMLFSVSIGEEDRRSLIDTMRIVIRRGIPIMCAVSLGIILLAEPFTRMFYRDVTDPVYRMTVMGFRLLPLCMPLSVISLIYTCYAQASEKKLLSIVLPIVDGFVGVSLTSLILIPLLKMNGLYLANILNGGICLAVILAFIRMEKKWMPHTTEEFLAIPDTFGAAENERIDITVRDMKEVETVSERIIAFCGSRGIDYRRSFYSGLAMEESAGNVILHGFTKDRKNHSADIRVVQKGDTIILRVRDDCRAFDPAARLELQKEQEEDRAKNIGLRLVYGIAKDIQYQNLLGLNVLTVRI